MNRLVSTPFAFNAPDFFHFTRTRPHFLRALTWRGGLLVRLLWTESAFRQMEAKSMEGRAALEGVVGKLAAVLADLDSQNARRSPSVRSAAWLRRAIGAMACAVMEANGFAKTGCRRVLNAQLKTIGRAEVYRRTVGRLDAATVPHG